MRRQIVIGLGFGDEGKGLVTDYLCSRDPKNTVVVRFSGGHQAGHTVMTNGQKHTHSSFGSGSLRGCPTYFTEHTCFYLNAMEREMEALHQKTGEYPLLTIHPLAKVTTPYDLAWNQLKAEYRPHESVGVGVGATMSRNITTPYKLFAVDLLYPELFEAKLARIGEYYSSRLAEDEEDTFHNIAGRHLGMFLHLVRAPRPFQIRDYSDIDPNSNIVFEGSQGIMLDMDHGVFPHVTYANTTCKNAIELIINHFGGVPELFYVTRAYLTRHGKGWMPRDPENMFKPFITTNISEEINVDSQWQGPFRKAPIDYKLLKHSLEIDALYHKGIVDKKNLVVTCLDQVSELFDYFHFPMFDKIYNSRSPETEDFITNYPHK